MSKIKYELYAPIGALGEFGSIRVSGTACTPEDVLEISRKLRGEVVEVVPEEAPTVEASKRIKHTLDGMPKGVSGKMVRAFLRDPRRGWSGTIHPAEAWFWYPCSAAELDIVEYEVVE